VDAVEQGLGAELGGLSPLAEIASMVAGAVKASLYRAAIAAVKARGTLHRSCGHRPMQYSNNFVGQDLRAIKRRVKAKQSFRECRAAGRTIAKYEAIQMNRKGQARWVNACDVCQPSRFIDRLLELAACNLAAHSRSRRPPSPLS
jgi:DDE domain